MKTPKDEIERLVLLEGSGELSDAERRALEAHPDAERCRKDVHRLVTTAREALPGGEPGSAALARIREAAEARISRPLVLRPPVLHGLAYAAALALLLGGWLFFAPNSREDRILEFHALLSVSDQDASNEAPGTGTLDPDLRALAQQLLLMEGLTPDDEFEAHYGAEDFIEDVEPSPTVLQERNTRGLHA